MLTAEDDGRACRDIPEKACNDQPKNFTFHIASLTLSKGADSLIDPKLVLSWMLNALGAPAFYLGLLVPLREAGALLPQLFTAGYLRSLPLRKWAWITGSLIQGACAALMGVSALFLEGNRLGVAIVTLLGLLALGRSICSVSYKDVLGKTVGKSKRGTATGTASSLAAILTVSFAFLLSLNLVDKLTLIIIGLFGAGLFWVIASALFAQLTEEPGATEGGRNPIKLVMENTKSLLHDKQLQLFILTRALLTATALAPPFMISLSSQKLDEGYGELGFLLLASSAATLCSSYIWGRLSDRSSRKVLILAGFLGALTLLLTVWASLNGYFADTWVLPVLLFSLMISYQGVRLGRSTHLVDMADKEKRATYTALSNSIIGVFLLAGGGFSLIAHNYGTLVTLSIFAVMSLAASFCALALNETQGD